MGEYLLSIFLIPNSVDARLTVLPLTDDADQEFPPVVTSRQALAEAFALLPQPDVNGPLPTTFGETQPVQIAVRSDVLHTLLALLERLRHRKVPPVH